MQRVLASVRIPRLGDDLIRLVLILHSAALVEHIRPPHAHNLHRIGIATCLLTDEEKVAACECSIKGGAKFVKTSTGFSTGGATAEDVKLMYETVKDAGLKVKASGGIKTLADAEKMIEAGAERLGCSAGMQIMKDFEERQ